MTDLRTGADAPTNILVRAALVAVSFLAVQAPAIAPAANDGVVVRYREVIGELAEAERGPSLALYADGRLRVHFPPSMRRAGDWEATLAPPAVDAIVQSLAGHGVLAFDAAAVRAQKRQRLAARAALARRRPGTPLLFEASDASTTIITLRTDGRERTVTWTGLRHDAKRHPDLRELAGLRAAQRELEALLGHPDLVRRGGPGGRP